jgi:hypothetical protein
MAAKAPLAAALLLAFGAAAQAAPMSKTDYDASRVGIAAEYKVAKEACDSSGGNAKDICVARAKGTEAVAVASLKADYRPTPNARYDLRIARAQAEYGVAKQKCDDSAGNVKDVCNKQADAASKIARADARAQLKTAHANDAAGEKTSQARAKAGEAISEARQDADAAKGDANYDVAKEKCDALAGVPRDDCVSEAKRQYGRS